MKERDQAAAVTAAIDRLALETADRLRGRVSGLRIDVQDGGVVLRGTARSFHAKQLALNLVMKGTLLPVVRNELDVVRGTPKVAVGSGS